MNITLLVIGVAIVAGLVGLLAYRRATAPKSVGQAKGEIRNQAEQWGVRIAASRERACPQVRPLLGKEFAMADKPRLPIRDCPYPQQCECRFIPLIDRRKEERRSGEDRRDAKRFEKDKPDRRSGNDRRKGGVDWDTHDL
jgi:hypothetical protein